MPFKTAAEVRAAHPGIYDDLSDEQIQAGLARTQAPAEAPGNPEMRHATAGDSPSSAFIGEVGRTAKEAGMGLLRSPWDMVKGLVGLPGQITKGLTEDLPKLVSDPSLLGEAPGAIAAGAKDLGDNPRDAGSLLGQMLLAPKVPGMAKAVVDGAPGVVGRGMSAVGRGTETVGKSGALAKAQRLAPIELVTGHPIAAGISAVAPDVLQGGGRLLQRGGKALEGLRKASLPDVPKPLVPESRRLGPARVSTQVRDFGQEMDPNAGSWERSPESNPLAPGRRGSPLQGLQDAAAGDNKWAGNASAQAEPTAPARKVEKNAFTHEGFLDDLKASLPDTTKRPIDTFLENDPQARIGGEGRMTGQFEEGDYGLNHLDANEPHPTPLSPLDELARLSNRGVSPTRAQELLTKLGGRGAGT